MNSDDDKANVVRCLEAHPDLPAWAQRILKNGIRGEDFHVSEQVFDASYLDFLNEQIALNARGDEWSKILKKRVEILNAWVGVPHWSITVSDVQSGRVSAYADAKNQQVFHVEIDNLE